MTSVSAQAPSPELFGGVHLSILRLTAILGILSILGARSLRGRAAETMVTQLAGWALLFASLAYLGWGLLPGNWDLENSLPLHYSDVLRFVTAVALIRRSRWAIAVAYYWGLTLNTQALLTPHPTQLVLSSVNSIFYWGLHIAVLVVPLVLIWGLGHRPSWRHFWWAYGLALFWAALVMPINALLGTNYAFLNRHPEGASVLDVLGPWPVYVLWQVVLVGLVWALMTWPWTPEASRRPARTAEYAGVGEGSRSRDSAGP